MCLCKLLVCVPVAVLVCWQDYYLGWVVAPLVRFSVPFFLLVIIFALSCVRLFVWFVYVAMRDHECCEFYSGAAGVSSR
jgi:hypothetical protein